MIPRNARTKSLGTDFLRADKIGLGILLYSYATLLGAAYVFGYWRTFGFDIFPFMSPLDYISAPLNRLLVVIAPPLLLGLIIFSGPATPTNEKRHIALYLISLYTAGLLWQLYEALQRFLSYDFSFNNEKSVLLIAFVLFFGGIWFGVQIYKNNAGERVQIIALLMLQIAFSMSAGYSDGKAMFNGAGNVMYLDNKGLCEENGVRDWVLIGKFTEQTLFMNTIDKRICVTAEKNFKLVSRKFKEGL